MDSQTVDEKNREGIVLVMKGEYDQALAMFTEALGLAGDNPELQAGCWVNIGDLHRRAWGDLVYAKGAFAKAWRLAVCKNTQIRIMAMEAMVQIYSSHAGEDDPEGVRETIALLQQALEMADAAVSEAEQARQMIFHRLAGTIATWGTPKLRVEFLPKLRVFRSRLPLGSAEETRLVAYEAIMVKDSDPRFAFAFLERCADQLKDKSPTDAGPWLIIAAEISQKNGWKEEAMRLCNRANEFRAALEKNPLGRQYIGRLDKVLAALASQKS